MKLCRSCRKELDQLLSTFEKGQRDMAARVCANRRECCLKEFGLFMIKNLIESEYGKID